MILDNLIRPRICELGKIKIGGKGETRTGKNGEWRLPVKYDHFVVTGLHRNDAGDLVQDQALMESLKSYADADGKLRQLPVALLSNEIEDILQASFVWYTGRQVAGRSDGKTCTFFLDPRTQKPLKDPIEEDWDPAWAERDGQGNRQFKLHTVFHCVLAAKAAKFGGVYKLRTTSQITAEQLYGSLLQVKMLTGGILRGVPLRLVVRPIQVSPDGKPTTVYVVHLELVAEDIQAIQAAALQRLQFELQNARAIEETQRQYRQILAIPGRNESPEEQAEVQEEFHPGNGAAASEPTKEPEPAKPPTLREQVDAAIGELARLKGVEPSLVLDKLMETAKGNGLKRQLGLDYFNDAWLRWSLDKLAKWTAQAQPPTAAPATPTPAPQAERQPGDDDLDDEGEGDAPPVVGDVPNKDEPCTPAAQQELIALLHPLGKAWAQEETRSNCAAVIGRQVEGDMPLSALTAGEAEAWAAVLRKLKAEKDSRVARRRQTVADRRTDAQETAGAA